MSIEQQIIFYYFFFNFFSAHNSLSREKTFSSPHLLLRLVKASKLLSNKTLFLITQAIVDHRQEVEVASEPLWPANETYSLRYKGDFLFRL